MATYLFSGPCGACGSSDACANYDDESTYCFSCTTYGKSNGEPVQQPEENGAIDWLQGEYAPLTSRGITEETCRKAGYQVIREGRMHLMNIRDESGKLVGQKTRSPDKAFAWRGPAKKDSPIYLSWMWPSKGRSVILTEGEIDAMSYWQAWGHKWPVGSLPNGASSVKKAILKHFEQLCGFENIYLSFDNDEPGHQALEEACDLLPAGKVKIITLPEDCKDANECLLKHGAPALVKAYYDAKGYRPDGIVEGAEITKDRIKKKRQGGYSLPFPKLNAALMGLRTGEITMLTAGSGIGKSTLARQIAYHLITEHGLKLGNVYLEEGLETTAAAYAALHAGVPLKNLLDDPDCITEAQWDSAMEAVVQKGMYYDHFGSLASDRLMTMLRFMAASGCQFIVLDHVSIVVSGMETQDERKDLDHLMTNLASFCKETGVGVIAVAHLKRTQKNFNEGGQVSLNDLRGSAALEQLSYNVIALERNQQDEKTKHLQLMRVLKCRITGETGEVDTLAWDTVRGCCVVASPFDLPGGGEDDEVETPF